MTVAPITPQGTDRVFPFEAPIVAGGVGLARPGKVLLDQVRTVDKRRLGTRIGSLGPSSMAAVNRAIRISLACEQ